MQLDVKKERIRTLTKKDILNYLNNYYGDRKYTIENLNNFFEAISRLLMSAKSTLRMELRDFGVFHIKPTKAKPKARNLKTGEFVYVPGRHKIHFKPGNILKEFLKRPSGK